MRLKIFKLIDAALHISLCSCALIIFGLTWETLVFFTVISTVFKFQTDIRWLVMTQNKSFHGSFKFLDYKEILIDIVYNIIGAVIIALWRRL